MESELLKEAGSFVNVRFVVLGADHSGRTFEWCKGSWQNAMYIGSKLLLCMSKAITQSRKRHQLEIQPYRLINLKHE